MFCLPNDTTLASCGLTSFENTLAIWDMYFCPKSQTRRLHSIDATTSGLNIKWHSVYVLPSQRHHPRLMWTFQIREHSHHLRHIFLPKSQIPLLHRITATASGINTVILNGTPLVFCLPNDSTLGSCGRDSFENTLAIWDTYFCPKSQILLLYRISAATSGVNIKWCSACILPSQRHRPRLVWTW